MPTVQISCQLPNQSNAPALGRNCELETSSQVGNFVKCEKLLRAQNSSTVESRQVSDITTETQNSPTVESRQVSDNTKETQNLPSVKTRQLSDNS